LKKHYRGVTSKVERIVSWTYAGAIGRTLDIIGPEIASMLSHVHFLTGTDPVFAGLHNCDAIEDGSHRSYRNTGHCCYPNGASDGRTTVVLPVIGDADTLIICHELGHCLDEVLGFRHTAIPVDDYAATNRYEAFAQSFTERFFWMDDEAEAIYQSDIEMRRLFDSLEKREA